MAAVRLNNLVQHVSVLMLRTAMDTRGLACNIAQFSWTARLAFGPTAWDFVHGPNLLHYLKSPTGQDALCLVGYDKREKTASKVWYLYCHSIFNCYCTCSYTLAWVHECAAVDAIFSHGSG